MKNSLDWRDKLYGKISGGQLEQMLAALSECWESRALYKPTSNVDEAMERIAKLTAVPNWVVFYQRPFLELVAHFIELTGTVDALKDAVASADPIGAVTKVIDAIPDEPPDHPAAFPIAFALIGTLEGIARYSRTINDMLASIGETGDIAALQQALSVDSTIITLPLCQAMLRYGQLTGDPSFAKALLRAIEGPHKKRLVYPKLRWAEYLLRDSDAFEACSQDEIFELLVVHLRLYGDDVEHKDAKKALFTLFRKWRKEAGI